MQIQYSANLTQRLSVTTLMLASAPCRMRTDSVRAVTLHADSSRVQQGGVLCDDVWAEGTTGLQAALDTVTAAKTLARDNVCTAGKQPRSKCVCRATGC
jgi:hypothetical protein